MTVPTAAPTTENSQGWDERERLEELRSLGSEETEFLRDAAKNNLYILAKGILGYKDINPFTHKELCEEVCRTDTTRRLFLMPRAHLKSTIITIADSIRLVLKNPDEAILIASETATQAQKFLKEIKNHWERNAVLRGLFPEMIPERLTGPGVDWSTTKASLNNEEGISRQSHWETIGVGGAPTGNHYTRIKPDDLIGLEAYRSPAKMASTKEWNDTIEPLLTNQHVDIIDWTGTRWARNDLYEHIMDFYGDALSVYTRTAIENGEIIFPQLHTWEEYQRLQTKNPFLWYAQYENNPTEGGPEDLPYGSIQAYYLTPDFQEVVIKNPDGSEKRWAVSDLDRVITVDPNSGSPIAPDMAAVHVSGLSPDDETFALESWSDRCDPHTLCWQTLRTARKWRPRVVAIERAGQQNTEFYFKKLCKEESYYVPVEPLLPKGRDKEERIRYHMQPTIASGKYFMLASQTVLRQQIVEFPNNLLIDELDAAAYAQEIHRRPGNRRRQTPAEKRQILKIVMGNRSTRTGY